MRKVKSYLQFVCVSVCVYYNHVGENVWRSVMDHDFYCSTQWVECAYIYDYFCLAKGRETKKKENRVTERRSEEPVEHIDRTRTRKHTHTHTGPRDEQIKPFACRVTESMIRIHTRHAATVNRFDVENNSK